MNVPQHVVQLYCHRYHYFDTAAAAARARLQRAARARIRSGSSGCHDVHDVVCMLTQLDPQSMFFWLTLIHGRRSTVWYHRFHC